MVNYCPISIFLNLFIYIYVSITLTILTTNQLMQCKMFHHLYPFKVIELNTTPVKKKS